LDKGVAWGERDVGLEMDGQGGKRQRIVGLARADVGITSSQPFEWPSPERPQHLACRPAKKGAQQLQHYAPEAPSRPMVPSAYPGPGRSINDQAK